MKNADMFADLTTTLAEELFLDTEYPWEVLPKIKAFVRELGPLASRGGIRPSGRRGMDSQEREALFRISTSRGPTIIGAESEVRPGAFIRGSVLVGKNCVVGNSTELKKLHPVRPRAGAALQLCRRQHTGELFPYGRRGHLLQCQE